MALGRQTISVSFGGGIETKQDPKLVLQTKLLQLQNGILSGAAGIKKRNGFKRLGSVPVLAGGVPSSLAVFNQELLAMAAGKAYSVSSGGVSTLLGALRAPQVASEGIYADNDNQLLGDSATQGGITAYAWQSFVTGLVSVMVKDEATGALLSAPQTLSTLANPAIQGNAKLVAVQGGIWLFFLCGVGTGTVSLKLVKITAAGITGAPITVTTSINTTRLLYSATVEPNSGDLVVTYLDTGNNIQLTGITKAGVVGQLGLFVLPGPVQVAAGVANMVLLNLVCAGSGRTVVAVAYATTAGVLTAAFYDLGLNVLHAATAISNAHAFGITEVTGRGDGTQFVFYFEVKAPAGQPSYNTDVRQSIVTAPFFIGFAESEYRRSVGIATEYKDGVGLGLVYDDGNGGQSTVFFDDGAGTIIGKALMGRSSGLNGGNKLPRWSQNAAGQWVVALGVKQPIVAEAGSVVVQQQALARVSLDFTLERFRSGQHGQSLCLAGAAGSSYDGVRVYETGFHVYPDRPSGTVGSLGFATVTYQKGDTTKQVVQLQLPPDDYSTVPITPCGGRLRASQYFILFDDEVTSPVSPARLVVWIKLDGVGTDPTTLSGGWNTSGTFYRSVEVDISSSDTQKVVAKKIQDAVNGSQNVAVAPHPKITAALVDVGAVDPNSGTEIWAVNFTSEVLAAKNLPLPVDDASFGMGVMQFGAVGVAEKLMLTCPAESWISAGQWFLLSFPTGAYQFYFTKNSVAVSVPLPPGITTQVAININTGDLPQVVANDVRLAIAGAAGTPWTATAGNLAVGFSGACVVVTCTANGAVANTATGGTRNNNVGGDLPAGKRWYYAMYEWRNAKGEYERSAPSLPFEAISASVDDPGNPAFPVGNPGGADPARTTHRTNIISVPTYRLNRRPGGAVQIALFRTQVQLGPGGGTITAGVPAYRVATLTNDPTVDSVSYTDTTPDSAITSAEVLYTCSGELPNGPPPACHLLANYAGRLWTVDDEDPLTLWFSKPRAEGYAPAYGLLGLTSLQVDQQGGPITALAVMDDRLVIFKASRIYQLWGSGPDVSGNGEWEGPVSVSTDAGCDNPESIVQTKDGLLFQSNKGVYLLDRSGQVHPEVGAAVQTFGQQSITSAVLKPGTTEVVLTSDEGPALLWDYFYGQWATFTNHSAAHAALWDGGYVYLGPDGRLMLEEDGRADDDGVPVQLLIETAWLKLDDVQGYGRLYSGLVLGTYLDPHKLLATFAYDYSDDNSSTQAYDAGKAYTTGAAYGTGAYGAGRYGGGDGGPRAYQVQLRPKRHRCGAVKITLVDQPEAGGAGSLTLTNLTLEIGVEFPVRHLPLGRRAG